MITFPIKKSVSITNNRYSKSEVQLIKHGAKMVNMVLNEEYERCTLNNEEKLEKSQKVTNAADELED